MKKFLTTSEKAMPLLSREFLVPGLDSETKDQVVAAIVAIIEAVNEGARVIDSPYLDITVIVNDDASVARGYVADGRAVLDIVRPGWWQEIDLDALDIADGDDCVIGQIYGSWDGADMFYRDAVNKGLAIESLSAQAENLQLQRWGFLESVNACEQSLTLAWIELIENLITTSREGN